MQNRSFEVILRDVSSVEREADAFYVVAMDFFSCQYACCAEEKDYPNLFLMLVFSVDWLHVCGVWAMVSGRTFFSVEGSTEGSLFAVVEANNVFYDHAVNR